MITAEDACQLADDIALVAVRLKEVSASIKSSANGLYSPEDQLVFNFVMSRFPVLVKLVSEIESEVAD